MNEYRITTNGFEYRIEVKIIKRKNIGSILHRQIVEQETWEPISIDHPLEFSYTPIFDTLQEAEEKLEQITKFEARVLGNWEPISAS